MKKDDIRTANLKALREHIDTAIKRDGCYSDVDITKAITSDKGQMTQKSDLLDIDLNEELAAIRAQKAGKECAT